MELPQPDLEHTMEEAAHQPTQKKIAVKATAIINQN